MMQIDWSNILHALGRLFQYVPDAPMLFNSGQFLTLFTVFIFIYALIYRIVQARTIYVLAFSLFFYYKASGFYLGILLLSVLLDYGVAFAIDGAKSKAGKIFWLVLSVSANIGLLCYFKYTNFFIENINALIDGLIHSGLAPGWIRFFSASAETVKPIGFMQIFLPIGISFYTFQTLSYIIDIYKEKIKPTKSLLDYAFYMTFFPHLVAGPIVRARDFLPQVRQELVFDPVDLGEGFFLIIKGLIKKAIVADFIAQYVDMVFGSPSGYSGFENLIAVYAYTLQIYCDFSGYSDMAIGIAKLMGFQLGDNFRTPYISTNITEFWRRWHISLSTWLRDYVYIPMGGNRKGVFNQYLFLFLTMLIGGFWHGPSWKFVLWGAVHGLGLVIHKLWLRYVGETKGIFANILGWFLTFHFVAFLWIFFRASSFSNAVEVLERIGWHMDWAYAIPFVQVRVLFCILFLAGYLLQFIPLNLKDLFRLRVGKLPLALKACVLLIVIQLVLQIRLENVQPFIYFQF